MQQNRSPGPVYDASRGYKYLEQVTVCMQIKSMQPPHHQLYALLTGSKQAHHLLPNAALSCAQLHLVCLRANLSWQRAVVPV